MKKVRLVAWILVIAMLMGGVSVPAFAEEESGFAGGSGTENDPYLIATAAQLNLLRERVHSEYGTRRTAQGEKYSNAYYRMIDDIDLNPGKWYVDDNNDVVFEEDATEFMGIGYNSKGYTFALFKGSFDGDGHTICGLYQKSACMYNGQMSLFSYVDNAEIKNLTVSGLLDNTDNKECTFGGIVGRNAGEYTVSNCISYVTIRAKNAGGIVYGVNGGGVVINCVNNGNIYCSESCAGIAQMSSKTTNCVNNGNLHLLGSGTAAGIVLSAVDVENCQNYSDIVADREMYSSMAGIAYNSYGNIYYCSNYGDIRNYYDIRNGSGYTAGIVCVANGSDIAIVGCLNTGNISGGSNTAGIVSFKNSYYSFGISKCMNTGNVDGIDVVGGIGGYLYVRACYETVYKSEISDCANTGEIFGVRNTGGILGKGETGYNYIGTFYYSGVISGYRNYNSSSVNEKKLEGIDSGYVGKIIGGTSGTDCSVSGYSLKTETSNGLTPAQMRNAESFKGFDFNETWAIDPNINNGYPYIKSLKKELTEYRKCIKITVPNGFAGQVIQVKNKDTEEEQKVYITENKNEYKIYSLANGEYDVKLISSRGDVFAQENNLMLDQAVAEIDWSDLPMPKNAEVTVKDDTGKTIEDGYSIKWYDSNGKYFAKGNAVTSLKAGSTVYYEIIPGDSLNKIYNIPPRQQFTVSDRNSISVTLTPRQKITVEGKVMCNGSPVPSAYINLSQKISDKLTDNMSLKTDSSGNFMFDALAGLETYVIVSKNGYFNTAYHYASISGNKTFELTKIDGIKIATEFETTNIDSDSVTGKMLLPENVEFSVTNTTKNQQITDFIYQDSAINIQTGAETGDVISITANDTQGEFISDTKKVTIGENNSVLFEMTEKGGLLTTISSGNKEAVLCLYDSKGNYLATQLFENNSAYIDNLDSGSYNAVIMAKSALFNALPKLSDYSDYSLRESEDYVLETINVEDGNVTEITLNSIPDFDEAEHGFVNSGKSYIVSNTTSVVPGNNVYVKVAYSVKDSYINSLSNKGVNVMLPDGCEVIGNVTLDGKTVSYTVEDALLTVPVSQNEGIIRFYAKPTTTGKAQISGYLQFDYNSSTKNQMLGSVDVEMKELSLSIPEKTAKTSIAVSGQVSPSTFVVIYDNNVPVCEVKSNKSGHFSTLIALLGVPEITEHIIYAEITTESTKIKSRSYKLVYDENYTALSKIIMSYNGNNMTFDYMEPSGVPSYTFVPSIPKFDFTAYFDGKNISSIADVYVVTTGADGKNTKVPMTYDSTTDTFKGSYNYDSTTCPRSVSATYALTSNAVSASGTASESGAYSADDIYTPNPKNVEAATPDESMSASVTSVTPNKASNGKITLKISGTLLKANIKPSLTNGNVTIPVDKLYWFNHQNVYAVFDLTDAPNGAYALICDNNGETLRRENCLTVDSVLPKGKIETEIHIGDNIKTGTEYKGSITFTNNGYTDVASPIVSLSGENVLFKLDDEFEDSLYEFAANKEGIAGVIGHGETAAINFTYKAENDGEFAISALTLEEIGGSLFEDIGTDVGSDAEAVLLSNMADMSGKAAKAYMQRAQERANLLDSLGIEDITYSDLDFIDYYNANAILGIETLASATDIASAELGFSRRYPSAITERYQKGNMGYGWSTDYSVTAEHGIVEETGDEYIAVTLPDKIIAFIKDGDDYIEPISGYYTASFDNNKVTVTAKDGSYLEFNPDGTLYRGYDAYGKFTQYNYSGGKLSGISSANGDGLTFTYSGDKLTGIASSLTGDSVTYGYTGDYLTSVTTKYGTTRYSYDTDSIGGKRHALTRIQYADGSYTAYSYDDFGRVTAISDNDGTVSLSYGEYNDITVTDEIGNVSHIYYDAIGAEVRTVDAAGNVSTAEYGYLTQPTSASLGFFNNYSYSYDEDHQLTGITDNDGNSVNYTYDSLGNISSVSDKRGIVTEYERNSKGQTTALVYADGSREQFTYDASGNMTTMTKRSGVSVSYTYDSFDRVTKEQYSTGEIREFTYDARGNVTSIIENGETTSVSYNEKGDITGVTYPDGKTVSYAYDSTGRMTSMTDNEGNTTSYTYDSKSRLASVTSGTASTSYTYNAAGDLTRKANSNGTVTEYTYENGNLHSITNKDAGGAVLSTFTYTYDECGNISQMTDNDGTWHYTYDKSGQLTKAVSPTGDITEYTYDLSGNRTSVKKNGAATAYTSNNLNQYTSIGGNSLSYDADGNMTLDAEGGTYEYDYLDRLIKYTTPDGKVYEYGYDAFGNRNSVTADGETTEYLNTPTGYGYVLAEYHGENVRHYIQGAGLTAMQDGDDTYFYSFNHLGSASELTNASGTVANSYKYDAEGKITVRNETIINPFTYVAEYGIADDNNGLYYMRARYVSQGLGRFINVDPLGQYADLNVHRYAGNDPIRHVDLSGKKTGSIGIGYTGSLGVGFSNSAQLVFQENGVALQTTYTPKASTSPFGGIYGLVGWTDANSYKNLEGESPVFGVNSPLVGGEYTKGKGYSGATFTAGPGAGGEVYVGNSTTNTLFAIETFTLRYWYRYVEHCCKICGRVCFVTTEFVRTEYMSILRTFLINKKLVNNFTPASIIDPTMTKFVFDIDCGRHHDKPGIYSDPYPDKPQYPSLPTNVSIDPSGYAYEAVPSNRVEGVTATVFYKETKETDDDFAELWDASEYDQENPLTTNSEGGYAWDVPDGWWQVRFEKDGYDIAYSEWLPVPPPQTDINVGITSMSAPKVTECARTENGYRITFSQYMNIGSVNSDNVFLEDEEGNITNGTITPLNAEIAGDPELAEVGVKYASEFELTCSEELPESARIYISNVYNYAGTFIDGEYTDAESISPDISGVTVSKNNYEYVFNIRLSNIPEGSKLLAALYDGDKLTGLKITNIDSSIKNEEVTVSAGANNATEAKVFIWSDVLTMRPLCDAKLLSMECDPEPEY